MGVLKALALFLRVGFVTRVHLTVEILALRQQLAVLKRSHNAPSYAHATACFGPG